MKKFLLIIIIISLIFLALFHNRANEFSKPYLAKLIEEKIDKNLTITVEEYQLDHNYITLVAKVDKKHRLDIRGHFNLFSKNLDLNYKINSKEYPIILTGKAKGTVDDILITGEGDILSSKLDYDFRVEKKEVKDVHISSKSAKIEEILTLGKQKKYATGLFDLELKMPKVDENKSIGDFKLTLKEVHLNSKVFQEEQNISIPNNIVLSGDIHSKLKDTKASIDADLKSNLFNIILENGIVNIKTFAFNSNYRLDIQELRDLVFFTKKELQGALKVTGNIKKEDKKFYLQGQSRSLDGKIDFILKDTYLDANFVGVSMQKIFYTLNYPLIFSAPLFGKVHYDLDKKKGTLNAKLDDAKLLENDLTVLIYSVSGLDLTKDVYSKTHLDAKLYENNIEFEFLARNRKNKILVHDANLKYKNNTIDAKYRVSLRKRDIEGSIYGAIKSPQVTIDGSNYLENKIDKELKRLGIDNIDSKKAIQGIGNLLQGFF